MTKRCIAALAHQEANLRNHINQMNFNGQRQNNDPAQQKNRHKRREKIGIRYHILKELAEKEGRRTDVLDKIALKMCWHRHLQHHHYMLNGHRLENCRLGSDRCGFCHERPEADTDELLDRMREALRLLTERKGHKTTRGRKARGKRKRQSTGEDIDPNESDG
jgi:hypothetical protein